MHTADSGYIVCGIGIAHKISVRVIQHDFAAACADIETADKYRILHGYSSMTS